MKVRKPRKSDYKELMRLFSEFIDDKRYLKRGSDSFFKFLANPSSYAYVLEDYKRLVGFITFSVRNVIRYPSPIIEIEELYIVPNYRGKNWGRKLIKIVVDKAKKINSSRIYIGSSFKWKIAHEVYKSMGFKKEGYQFLRKLRNKKRK